MLIWRKKCLIFRKKSDRVFDEYDDFSTVWKFEGFSVTQILREINFKESRNPKAKTDVFAIFGVMNFVNLVFFILQNVQKFIKIKIHRLWIC